MLLLIPFDSRCFANMDVSDDTYMIFHVTLCCVGSPAHIFIHYLGVSDTVNDALLLNITVTMLTKRTTTLSDEYLPYHVGGLV